MPNLDNEEVEFDLGESVLDLGALVETINKNSEVFAAVFGDTCTADQIHELVLNIQEAEENNWEPSADADSTHTHQFNTQDPAANDDEYALTA